MTPPPAELGIGTATFLASYGINAGPPPGDALVRAAMAGGVRYFDTAAEYGDGEAALGRTRRPGLRICTKVKAGAGIDDVRRSVDRLAGPPDTILMHSAGRAQLTSSPAIDALREAKEQGLCARIGASTYGADDAVFALSREWVDVIQVEYSVLNQSVLRAIAPRAGQQVVVRSVLCKGLLTSRRTAAPALAAAVHDTLGTIEARARDWNHTMETLAIRFALDTPGVDVVLVGVSSEDELAGAVASARATPLTPAQWAALAALDRSDADAVHPERWGRTS